ncbi:MAG: UvrD-helicase domain-containing protein [Flavobacteriales bacterium]|nr:MAG: UvrD-helicase domain-containing protein [Flavobacteriales bacterium]
MTAGAPIGFFVLRSSAGAGKTHALVKHYLRACLCSPDPGAYRRVLALTFTNRAAGEMKERVLSYLQGLANGNTTDGRLADVRADLLQRTGLSDDELAARAKTMHHHMLHHWSQLAISTIDAFTRRITRPFARDLRLDNDLEMTTEEDYYLQAAVDRLLEAAVEDDWLRKVLTETCRQLLEDEQDWNARKPLHALAKELIKESAVGPLQALRDQRPEDAIALANDLRTWCKAHTQRMRAFGKQGLAFCADNDLGAGNLAFGDKGVLSWFRKVARFPQEDFAPLPPSRKQGLEVGKLAGSKVPKPKAARVNALAPGVLSIVQSAEAEHATNGKRFIVSAAVLGKLMPTAALQALDEHLDAAKQEDGVAFFSDLTRKVAELVREEHASFIHERIGERYLHYLIDEFQDTSRLQWTSLLPLVENALGNNGSALIVGDAKQAIYRWRNGDVRQFMALPRLHDRDGFPDGAARENALVLASKEPEPLPFNYRSTRTVVEFNNALFAHLAQGLPPQLAIAYAGQEQRVKNEQTGLVHVRITSKEEQSVNEDGVEKQFLLESVQQALGDGFAPGDIAVLVQAHSQGARIATWLSGAGHEVTSADAMRLGADKATTLLIDLLRYVTLLDPTAGMRAIQALALIHGNTQKGPLTWEVEDTEDPLAPMDRFDEAAQLTGADKGLRPLLMALARTAGLDHTNDAHVLFLLDQAHAFSVQHGDDALGFLEHWERTGSTGVVEIPPSPTAISIVTVHKSKGLEYPVVILPYTERKGGRREDLIWMNPGTVAPQRPQALVALTKELTEADVPEATEEQEEQALDKLNMLYVACTRAEERLYLLLDPASGELTQRVIAHVEAQGVADGKYISGERSKQIARTASSTAQALVGIDTSARRPPMLLRMEAPQEWDPANPDPFRSRGNALHEIVARTTTAQDLPSIVEGAVRQGLLPASEQEAALAQLSPALSSAALAPWFDGTNEVRSEVALITADGHTVRPDRLAFTPQGIRVLDLKTGAPRHGHRKQVLTYMQVLREAGETVLDGHLFYLESGQLERVGT